MTKDQALKLQTELENKIEQAIEQPKSVNIFYMLSTNKMKIAINEDIRLLIKNNNIEVSNSNYIDFDELSNIKDKILDVIKNNKMKFARLIWSYKNKSKLKGG